MSTNNINFIFISSKFHLNYTTKTYRDSCFYNEKNRSWSQGLLIFVMACLGNFAFASATQGWFITRNRFWEVPFFLSVTFILMRPDQIAKWLGVPYDQRYWTYLIGLFIFGLLYLIQMPRSRKQAALAQCLGFS